MQHLELLKVIIINTTQHAIKMPNYLKITYHSRFHEKTHHHANSLHQNIFV